MPRDDQYFYIRSTGTELEGGPGGAIALLTQTTKRWVSATRPNILQSTTASIRYPSARDKRVLGPAPANPLAGRSIAIPAPGGYHIGYQLLTRAQLGRYLTSPRAIYQRLNGANHGASPTDAVNEIVNEISETLSASPMPAALRSGFYRALALIPGLRLKANARDAAGRTGVAASIVRAGVEEELIFDPTSAEILAERKIVLNPHLADLAAKRGTVIHDITYYDRTIANAAPSATPLPGGTGMVCTSKNHCQHITSKH
jgi:hypothetical protein